VPFPVEWKYIEETQRKLSVRFPLDYVVRMKRENGSTVSIDDEVWFLFPIYDTTDERRIKRTCNDVCHETKEARLAGVGFPPAGVAIADNGAGDRLFFLPEADDAERLRDTVFCFRLHGGEIVDTELSFGELT
jgi:hypothetical protein